jgi:hypothetical protein
LLLTHLFDLLTWFPLRSTLCLSPSLSLSYSPHPFFLSYLGSLSSLSPSYPFVVPRLIFENSDCYPPLEVSYCSFHTSLNM